MIVFITRGGLGNRMRALASAYKYAKDKGQKLIVIWPKDGDLNCSFHSLFQSKNQFVVIENPLVIQGILKFFLVLSKVSKEIMYLSNSDVYEIRKTVRLEDYFDKLTRRVLIVESDMEFYTTEANKYSFLEPTSEIINRVNEISRSFPPNIVGIHIRSGDNRVARKKSTVPDFIEKMKSEIAKSDSVKFFLCTDTDSASAKIKKEFGSRILEYSSLRSRENEEGIKEALIDLYCLSKTSKIIGSYWSSFSETAGELGGKPIEVVNNESH